jgi:hypothetical protein
VGPRTVTDPGGGISFNSSSSLQSAINAQPINSVFVCSVSNPTWTGSVFPGTKQPTIIFPGPVGQKVISGGGGNFIAINGGNNVTIKGGTWQNFANQFAGIVTGDDWVIQDAVVTAIGYATGGVGISVQGSGALVSHCALHSNTNMGMTVITGGHGAAVEYCEIYNNNTGLFNPGNQGGAFKFFQSSNGWVHHNWVHDNIGFGMWWDTLDLDWLIEENVSENNQRTGLFYEANFGSVIRRNYVVDNGRDTVIGGQNPSPENCTQVRLSDCNAAGGNPVQVTRNYIDFTLAQTATLGGLLLIWDHTGTTARSAQNTDVFENQFWLRGTNNQRVGGEDTASGGFPVWSSDNNFFNNEYRVASNTVSYWKWDTGTGVGIPRNFTEWQGFHPTGETRISI